MYRHKIVSDIRLANVTRSPECVKRRLLKVLEEIGEVSEAYLSRTSQSNYKNKTWLDYREEGVDTLIVLIDIALTPFPESVSFPSAALIPSMITDAKNTAKSKTVSNLETCKFDIVGAVCRAENALNENNILGFYGAINRAIGSAASICYAHLPEDESNDIEEIVYALVQQKLAKWMGKSATSEIEFITKPVIDDSQMDAAEYFQHLRDREE